MPSARLCGFTIEVPFADWHDLDFNHIGMVFLLTVDCINVATEKHAVLNLDYHVLHYYLSVMIQYLVPLS